jgi:4-amino-4-deoxy-L-arabinose transferase-like glycosyltransferase
VSLKPVQRVGAWLLVIAIAGLAIRLLALIVTEPTGLVNDELVYQSAASRMASGKLRGTGPPPGVIVFYAGLFSLFEVSSLVARAGNVVLSAATVPLVFVLGRSFAGVRCGLAAAAIAALYPGFIGFSVSLWSETLYIFLLLGGLALIASLREPLVPLRLVAAGALVGLAGLTRAIGVPVALCIALMLVVDSFPDWKTGSKRVLPFLASCFAVLFLWGAHMKSETGLWALSSRSTWWFNVYVGNAPPVSVDGRRIHPVLNYPNLGPDNPTRQAEARRLALEAIWDRMPFWPIEKLAELPKLAAPRSFIVDRLQPEGSRNRFSAGDWGYRYRFEFLDRPAVRQWAVWITSGAYIVLALAGIGGLILCGNTRTVGLFGLVIAGHVAPLLMTFALTRYRLPVMPLLIVAGAPLLLAPVRSFLDATASRRVLAALAMTTALCVIALGCGDAPQP